MMWTRRHKRRRSYFKGKQQEHGSEDGDTEYEPNNVRDQDHREHCQDLYVHSDRNVGRHGQLLGRQEMGVKFDIFGRANH